MKPDDYLRDVLKDQDLPEEGAEIKELRREQKNIENILKSDVSGELSVRSGGSVAKGSLIRESYDLDVQSYAPEEEDGAGETLEDIYDNHEKALAKHYFVERKRSAIRLRAKDKRDLRIDVVPGRFVKDGDGDVFLHQTEGEKERLKTNPEMHVQHVKNSGYVDEIRLAKLWKARMALDVKTFVLELLLIQILKDKKANEGLAGNLRIFWDQMSQNAKDLVPTDPANGANDLGKIYPAGHRTELADEAKKALKHLDTDAGWEKVFGKVEHSDDAGRLAAIATVVRSTRDGAKPWSPGPT